MYYIPGMQYVFHTSMWYVMHTTHKLALVLHIIIIKDKKVPGGPLVILNLT